MSTKTTLKRIALVAVSALGFGGLSVVVAPASNAAAISSITVGTIPTARVGEVVTIPITINLDGAGATTESTVIAAKVSSAPSTAAGQTATSNLGYTVSGTNATGGADDRLWLTTNPAGDKTASAVYGATSKGAAVTVGESYLGVFIGGSSGNTTAGNIGTAAAATAANPTVAASFIAIAHTTANSVTGYLSVKPDVAGTYSILVSATNGTAVTPPSLSYEAGVGLSTVVTFTTGGAPTALTLTNLTGTTNTSGTYGALLRLNLTGALTGDEAISCTATSGNIAKATVTSSKFVSGTPSSTSTARLTKADFINGIGFVNVEPSAVGTTSTVTCSGTGSLASSLTASTTVSSAAAAADLVVTSFGGRDGTVVASGWSSATATSTTARTYNVPTGGTSTTVRFDHADVADATTMYGVARITDTSGDISGSVGGSSLFMDKSWTVTGTSATTDTYSTMVLSYGAMATGDSIVIGDGATTALWTATQSATLTAAARTVVTTATTSPLVSASSATASPSPVRAAAGGSVAITATFRDQFNSRFAGISVTTTVAGRNGARASQVQTTDSNGTVTSTITDAGTSTSAATDTVTFTATVGSATRTATASITWGAFTVGTVTLTGGATASDTYKGQNTTAITTSAAGPDGAGVSITATVKDADGSVLSGVPVTFTVSKGLVRKTSTVDYATVYTDATGKAVTQVIDWTEGEQVITATAGGKTGTDYITWEAKTASSARSVSGVASGNKVTATVKDRFGNTVKGVTVSAKTSNGYFGSGTSSTTGVTDADGQVAFFVTGAAGATTVTLSLDKDTYVQSIDVAGKVADTAVTAAVAGTTTGTGASFADAGVNSVAVALTATDAAADAANAASDAAAEAIDAANAATDAANLAAEAADAATVAAEEARDAADAATAAVEELATQVATLMAALKAQITTLANTVAKIAKKVRA